MFKKIELRNACKIGIKDKIFKIISLIFGNGNRKTLPIK